MMDSQLPHYARPPVIETVLGFQFDRFPQLDNPVLMSFWAQHQDTWPRIEEVHPLDDLFEFFGDKLSQSGQRALSHLRARDANDHRFVRLDHDPCVDFVRKAGLGLDTPAREWKVEAQGQSGSSAADHEIAARYVE